MLDAVPEMLSCATRAQEKSFVQAAIEVWHARNIDRHPSDALQKAVQTVVTAYESVLDDGSQWEGQLFLLDGPSDDLRRVLGILIKLSLSFARSGIDQASVHAGFTHPDRVVIIWHPDRYRTLSIFTRQWVNALYARIAELENIKTTQLNRTTRH